MKNTYQVEEAIFCGLRFFMIWGTKFCFEDLYELVGKEQFMTSFNFNAESEAFYKYGESVTGLIFYAKEECDRLELIVKQGIREGAEKIFIDSYMPDLSQCQREDLKYGGVFIKDIGYISYGQYNHEEERYGNGDKKVPNIIHISTDCKEGVDYDRISQSYLVKKNNDGIKLLRFEKEKLVGITLAINDGHIDPRILKHLQIEAEEIQNNINIGYHYLITKERRKNITTDESAVLLDLKTIRYINNFNRFIVEVKKSRFTPKELQKHKAIIELIKPVLNNFEPEILLHGQNQIYWDIDSYLHIVMRHTKPMQIGRNIHKTPLPYRFEDLESLIQKVLGSIEDEIHRHYQDHPGTTFRRSGRMNVLFNGDYFCLEIDKEGRLVSFYSK